MATDYYQILNVPRTCDLDTLRSSFRQLSRTQHPDRFDESQRAEAEKRYQEICVAFNTLKDEKQRARYDKMLSPSAAKQVTEDPATLVRKYYQTGMSRMSQADYEGAIECFKRAIHYQADAEFFFQKGLAEAMIPRLRKDALASIQRAIELKPTNPKYHVQIIRFLIDFGLEARARVLLEKAMTQFRGNPQLEELDHEMDPKKNKKGLFGNLFGRN